MVALALGADLRVADGEGETIELGAWSYEDAATAELPPGCGTRAAIQVCMSDARQSPIPQDRVNENVDQRDRAATSKHEQRQQERYLKDQGVDERPGTNPKEQPGIPGEPASPAEGGD